MATSAQYSLDPNIQVVTGVCPHDCPDSCSWQVAVERSTGQAVALWGHPHHPVTRGQLCGKVDRYLERTYHSDRLTIPLRRAGPKGQGHFVPVSWQTALAEIGQRLGQVIRQYGAEAVLPYSYAGTMGILQGEGMAQRFFNQMGASRLARTICSEAGFEGYSYTVGTTMGMETESYAHARLILIWGSNTLTSNLHLWPFITAARKAGARVMVIDPARTRTAQAADEWIPIQPGTDGALALALMQVIVAEGLVDQEYVERYTLGYAQLAARVADWTPERATAITGVPAARIRQLARDYATRRPAAIRINYGLQRHAGGGMAVRTIACLPALVGAWRDYGGGIQLSTSGHFPVRRSMLQRPDLLAGRRPRTLNMNRLGDALSRDPALIARAHHRPRPVDAIPSPAQAGPPVQALVVYNCNPAAVAPDQGAVTAGLAREDLFTVVLEQFPTDTAAYADYLLPATTQLEHWDLLKPYGHLFLALNRPAIAPLGESLPNSEIFRRLAAAMGYTDPCFDQSDEEMLQEFVAGQHHPSLGSMTWQNLLERGYVRLDLPDPYLPFAAGGFPTPSGKCEFYSQRMARDGYDPLPTYMPPRSRQAEPEAEFPAGAQGRLVCISPPAHSFLNSSFANLERFRKREETPLLWIHPQDAADRGVEPGGAVRVWNELGAVTLTARVTNHVIRGTVLAPGVWWSQFSPDGRNINRITAQDEADMGSGATFYDSLVQVERVVEPASSPTAEEEQLGWATQAAARVASRSSG